MPCVWQWLWMGLSSDQTGSGRRPLSKPYFVLLHVLSFLVSKPYFRSLQDIKPHKKVYLPIINDPFYFVMVRSGFCHLSIPLPPYVQESNHFGGEGVTRQYHTRAPSIRTVTVLYLDICLTTLDLEDFFSPSFFAFEKGKWKRMMLCSHRWNAKWIKKRLVHRSQVIREIDISGKRKRERC